MATRAAREKVSGVGEAQSQARGEKTGDIQVWESMFPTAGPAREKKATHANLPFWRGNCDRGEGEPYQRGETAKGYQTVWGP